MLAGEPEAQFFELFPNLLGIEAVNPVADDFYLAVKVYDFAEYLLKGRNRIGVGLPFLILVIGIEGMGHETVEESVKLRAD
jgi:hypothetical protein